MTARFPHITISIAHEADGSDTTGDLNSLSVGFGLFQAWVYIAIFGASAVFGSSPLLPGFPYLPAEFQTLHFDAFMIALAVLLLLLAFSNQIFLRFYVGKNALILATCLAVAGTCLIYGSSLPGVGWMLAVLGGASMGAGASLTTVLWGTAFSRYEFTTIVLNTIASIVIGVAGYVILVHWVIAPVSGVITAVLPIVGALLLWKLTPIPYYRRQEIPIFHPLPVHRTAFALRFGIPVLVFGFCLGALRHVCVSGLLLVTDLTSQLIIGAAACAAIAIMVATMVVSRDRSHWDMAFRCLIPLVALAIFCIPLLNTEFGLISSFFVIAGYICFEAVIWALFSEVSQEFRLSPIFVFGLGRGILEIGALVGSTFAQLPPEHAFSGAFGDFEGALVLMLALVVGHALLPRQREIRKIVDPTHVMRESGLTALRAQIDSLPAASEDAEPVEVEIIGEESVPSTAAAEAVAEVDERSRAKGRFHARCEQIADQYLLSRRETEVMFLLAKGHNASFIQDKLCISKSTAKTHINHIYRKLDIHTQQELLNMVEDRQNDAEGADEANRKGGASEAASAHAGGSGVSSRPNIFEPRHR